MGAEEGRLVKAVQGHGHWIVEAAAEAAGKQPVMGRPYRVEDGYFTAEILHGCYTADAAHIYRDGVECSLEANASIEPMSTSRARSWSGSTSRGKEHDARVSREDATRTS